MEESGDIAGGKVRNKGKLIEDAVGDEEYGEERRSGGIHFGGVVDGDWGCGAVVCLVVAGLVRKRGSGVGGLHA